MTNDARPRAFVDVETTGTQPGRHEIIEIGAVVASGEKSYAVTDSFEMKAKPQRIAEAEPAALMVNRYSDEEWRDALPIDEAVRQFCDRVRGASLYAWNAGFDRAFLEPAMNRAGCTLEGFGLDYTWYDVKMNFICWAKLARREDEFAPRFSLGSAARAFRVENDDAHRALSDALTTYRIFLRLEEEFNVLAAHAPQRLF